MDLTVSVPESTYLVFYHNRKNHKLYIRLPVCITKTSLFKYTENFTTKKLKIFR